MEDFRIQNEGRSKKLEKKRNAWTGGGFGVQRKRLEQNNFYAKEKLKNVKKRIRIRMSGEEMDKLTEI